MTVWITGGSRGIGAAEVRTFAQAGWQVAFSYRTSHVQAQALVEELPGVLAVHCDMSVQENVKMCAAEIHRQFGPVQALVCNAGIAQQKMFCDLLEEDWDTMFAQNVKSVFYAVQAVLSDMVHQKSGSVVTTSSIWGITGASCESHYAASKAAIIGLTRSLALELGPSGIRVNCIAPGVIDTEMNAGHTAQVLHALAEETPLCRLGTPEEVAQAARFLCSADASFITGQILGVSGGFAI